MSESFNEQDYQLYRKIFINKTLFSLREYFSDTGNSKEFRQAARDELIERSELDANSVCFRPKSYRGWNLPEKVCRCEMIFRDGHGERCDYYRKESEINSIYDLYLI